ncbi:PhzF family phenazine biosynthesis protein [Pseudomarimonas salicorniae]|uniref:PhzF family phenazine biosynthesis protein n=1 Tax=Pseudomarimonas salicorniae TaxID=2933270 RepID=A0ABT0GEY4_9GAMM|nr:PhzF family phenazine biosynthesis protein [Lysobacter sp. CAU 1642]MCK7593109.1 PhzF family phenazine biosynthesis protein [Lysobacter sp. CAU 1642]
MTRFAYWQMDVFAARRGGGNPLGVVLDARGWSDRAMQSFARWTNLVETTFVLPAEDPDADYRVRMFTPGREIPFAAHPSLGTAQALIDAGRLPQAQVLHQQCGIGTIPIRHAAVDGEDWLFLRSPPGQVAPASDGQRRLAEHLLQDRLRSPGHLACMQGGRRWWIAEFASEAALREWRAPVAAIAELAEASDTLGLCGFARTGSTPQLAVRAFPAGVGIAEDPASGAANGLIASWLAQSEPEGDLAGGYRVSQGREIGHDALIEIGYDADGTIWVGGHSHTIVRGEAEWEIDG